MEKLEHYTLFVRMQNGAAGLENSLSSVISSEVKHRVTIWPRNSTSRYILKRNENMYSYKQLFHSNIIHKTKRYKQLEHLSIDELINKIWYIHVSSVQSLSHVRLFLTPWITGHQASPSISNSRSSPKPMSIESVMPSSHLILCCPLLLLPSIFPGIRVFSNESALRIRWLKY